MTEAPEADWIEPYKGMKFEDRVMTVEAQDQARLVSLCGIDPSVFGDKIDPAGFISLAIQEGVRNKIHANATINMVQQLVQHRQMTLGEKLTVSGEILDVKEVPRGRVATSEVWFSGADGKRALTATRQSLRPDPSKVGLRGAGERPAPVIADVSALKAVGRFTLRPEDVKAYSGPHNPIHFDPEVAKRNGYRAPIIAGTQCVRFVTAEIWRRFKPRTLDLDIYFRRPLFWDDTFSVMVDERNGEWKAICLAKDGKVATEARINSIGV
jgi:hydroxyacyl-ACP dehydratase HTD2-like protein with hotdog domain